MLCSDCIKVGLMSMLTIANVERVNINDHKIYQMDLVCPHCNAEFTWAAMDIEALKPKKKQPLSGEPK